MAELKPAFKLVQENLKLTCELTVEDLHNHFINEESDSFVCYTQLPIASPRKEKIGVKIGVQIECEDDEENNFVGIFIINSTQFDIEVKIEICNPIKFTSNSFQIETDESRGFPKIMSKKDLLKGQTLILKIHLEIAPEVPVLLADEFEPRGIRNGQNVGSDIVEKFWNNKSSADTKILVGGKCFPCHKTILTCRSDVFRAILQIQQDFVEIRGCDRDDFKKLLKYIYTDYLEDYNSVSLLLLSDQYKVPGLRMECERALAAKLDIENAIDQLSVADRIEATFLQKMSSKFIYNHLDVLEGTEKWNKLIKDDPKLLCLIIKNRK